MTVVDLTKPFLRRAENEIEKAVARGTVRVQREAHRLANQNAGPTRSNPKRPSSSPGEPPHVRTGTLVRSLQGETLGSITTKTVTHPESGETALGGSETFKKHGEFTGRVGTNLKYGRWLELGTRKMKKRPYLRPALDSQRNRIVNEILKARKAIERGR